ncbi:hypothetical protein LCGC14_2770770 [marine sediment metagenome]|uniref:Uncharacterized protein n=1 Tax=marine sediment metagenome TaxID=412755 RepID=A0A0F8YWA7_9ZZZZ
MSVTAQAGRVQQICEALVLLLDVADAADEFKETIGAKRVYTTLTGLHEVGDTVVTMVAPVMTKRARDSNGTYGRYVVVEILVRVHLTNDVRDDLATMDNRVYLAELIDNYLAAEANSDLTLVVGANEKTAEYIEPTDKRADKDIRDDLGVLWDSADLVEKRQQTVLVRVAYWVDEDY